MRLFQEKGALKTDIQSVSGKGGADLLQLFFGGSGCHRFAIARILELSIVPAQIGCVHKSAIPFLPILRQMNHTKN